MPKLIDLDQPASQGVQVSTTLLSSYVDRYKNERLTHILQHVPNDSRGAWISRHKLEEFLNNNPDATGMRMYFGVIDDINIGYEKGVHNLVLVPTEKLGQGNRDMLKANDWVIVLRNPVSSAIAGSEGAICPPPRNPCGGNQIPY